MLATKTTEKIQATETTKIEYREPGTGAIEFARPYVEGLHREVARVVINDLIVGKLHDVSDKRVKRCDYCGYWWRDDSLRNRKRTCSDECKRNIKTVQRRQQRADAELLNPKPKKQVLMDDYVHWLEYPYWLNEYSMLKIGWKYSIPKGIEVMDYIEAKKGTYGEGNCRKITTSKEF